MDLVETSPPPPSLAELKTHPSTLTVSDVAKLLRCSPRHVMNLVERGSLRKVPSMGRSIRFAPVAVIAFVNGETATAK